jgi:hypothetical protein
MPQDSHHFARVVDSGMPNGGPLAPLAGIDGSMQRDAPHRRQQATPKVEPKKSDSRPMFILSTEAHLWLRHSLDLYCQRDS